MSLARLSLCGGMRTFLLCLSFVVLCPYGVWAETSLVLGMESKRLPFNSVASFNWKSEVAPHVQVQPKASRFSRQASVNASVYSNKVLQVNTYRSVGAGQQIYPSASYGASASSHSQAASTSVNLPIHLGAADKWTQPQSPLSSNVQSLAAMDMAVMQKDRPVGPIEGGDTDIPGVVPIGNGIPVALFLCVVYVFVKSYRRERV